MSDSQRLDTIRQQDRYRTCVDTRRHTGATVWRDGVMLHDFSANDYLGLSQHPALAQAAIDAITSYGVGAGASRLVTGNHPLYAQFEARFAALKRAEWAILFGSGYQANVGLLSSLPQVGDLIVMDRLAHASLIDGARLSSAAFRRFTHNDANAARRLLTAHPAGRRFLVTESVFSMDGDRAPLFELAKVAEDCDATLIVDEAHSFGLPAEVCLADMLPPYRWIGIGTLSKAAGSFGGVVYGSAAMAELLVNLARPLIYTTALPPAIVAASLAALDVMAQEPERGGRAMRHAERFCHVLGLPQPESAIVPLIMGEAGAAVRMAEKFVTAGFYVPAIRPPTVPPGTARLRFSFSAAHGDDAVEALIACAQEQLCVS